MIRDSDIRNVVLIKAAIGKLKGKVDLFLPTTRHLHSPGIMQSVLDFVPFTISGLLPDITELTDIS